MFQKTKQMHTKKWQKTARSPGCDTEHYNTLNVGNDLKQQEMGDIKSRAFTDMAGAEAGDDVWFSFIVFESKGHRDEVNAKVMQEMGETYDEQTDFVMPNDMTKMAYGGFEVVVEG